MQNSHLLLRAHYLFLATTTVVLSISSYHKLILHIFQYNIYIAEIHALNKSIIPYIWCCCKATIIDCYIIDYVIPNTYIILLLLRYYYCVVKFKKNIITNEIIRPILCYHIMLLLHCNALLLQFADTMIVSLFWYWCIINIKTQMYYHVISFLLHFVSYLMLRIIGVILCNMLHFCTFVKKKWCCKFHCNINYCCFTINIAPWWKHHFLQHQ